MLTKELTHYHPTILCLQEVDLEQYGSYFTKLLRSLGYDHVLLAAKKKRQGLLVAWEDSKYKLIHRKDVRYDRLNAGTIGPTMWTGNVGIVLGLQCKDTPSRGLWVSNTHLYWHPRGSYERQRQAGILVSESMSIAVREPTWPMFICGGNFHMASTNARFQFYAEWNDLYCSDTTANPADTLSTGRIKGKCVVRLSPSQR